MIGTTISHYKILEKLGKGGMGEVYLAEDLKLERKVAIKLLPQHLTKDKENVERFEREAKAAAALNHPNIVTIYEIAEVDNQTFIVMEYIDGQSLRTKIENGISDLDEILNIINQICDGLSEAHKEDVVHRDIKPENILIDKNGRVKILDFGLAKLKGVSNLTKETSTLGTIHYMSPEQIQGEEVDQRADIWSLGVVLYEMLIGAVPFTGTYDQAIIYSILNENPKPVGELNPDISKEIEDIIKKLLRKQKEIRYQDYKEIVNDLQETYNNSQPGITKSQHKQSEKVKKLLLFMLPSFLILLIVFWYIFFYNQNNQLNSIAILPFHNSSQDPDLAFLSKEIPANIINNLSRLPNLRVVPRTTVFRYADRESDLASIGQDLGVTSVLTGQVNVIGENIIIRADLINIKKDSQIWGDRFERKFSDLFEIEEEITKEISEILPIHLTGEQKSNLVKRYTENIEAYRTYMEGRFWWNKRSPEGFTNAEMLFKKAITIDPSYALAYAGLAECYCMAAIHMPKPEPVIRKARIAVEKALSIDKSLAEAHAALGWIKFIYDWDWLGSERSFKQAIQLNPHYATTYNWFAVLLSFLDRHEEAIRFMIQAQKLDPGSAIINRDLGIVYAWAGEYANAIKQLQFTIDLEPDFTPAYFLMGVVHMYLKKYDLAIDYFNKVESMAGNYFDIIGHLGYAYAQLGQTEAAYNELKKLEALNKNHQDARASEFCFIYLGLGNYEQAFKWLDIACKNHEFQVLIILGCESELWLENLANDTRLQDFLKRIGLEK
jgi:serine/threonine protein kinase/tetratricopeptide (TPR) repeat protein